MTHAGEWRYYYRVRIDPADIYDGDTLRCDFDMGRNIWHHNQAVRLYGIDTPELRGGTPESRQAAKRARDYLRALIEDANECGSDLTVETHRDRAGKYGRDLVTLWVVPKGAPPANVNLLLVDAGYAKHYP